MTLIKNTVVVIIEPQSPGPEATGGLCQSSIARVGVSYEVPLQPRNHIAIFWRCILHEVDVYSIIYVILISLSSGVLPPEQTMNRNA